MSQFELVLATIDHIRETNARHRKKGFRALDATPQRAVADLMSEVAELANDIAAGIDPTEELADVLAVLLHTIRICDVHDDDVIGMAVDKLQEAFDIEA
jgi:NTP pyrophosphatase (non-canonical NTP hydrolase)